MGFNGGKSGAPQAKQHPAVSGLQIQTSALGKAIPIVYGATRIAGNLVWYGDFKATAHQSAPPGGGKGGVVGGGGKGGSAGSATYTYQTGVAIGLAEGPIAGVNTVYANKQVMTPASLSFSIFTGTYPQTPWGVLATKFPAEALGYTGLAYLAADPYNLHDVPTLPNHNFEVFGRLYASAPNGSDADPSQVIADLLTNPDYGAGFPAARLGSLATYQAYALALGLWISPAYTEQRPAAEMLDEIAKHTNSAFVWSGGELTLVPYGDQPASGNGFSYTPPGAPLYDLTDDDFLPNTNAGGSSGTSGTSGDPVLVTRKRPADALNDIKLEFLNRANQYNPEVVEAFDQAMIDLTGRRSDGSRQAHLFADAAAARLSAQLQLQRESIRNVYQFTLGQRYILLDPMDIVTLTDPALGLDKQWVRITEITEDDNGNLLVTAEEYLAGTGSAALYNFGTSSGYAADYNVAPPATNPPIVFAAPVALAQLGLEIWIVVSGGANWGGCDIWVSSDGNTYKQAARSIGGSRQGVLTATLPAAGDPDTTHALSVDLSMSEGALLSGTQADADAYHTLCYVDGELASYETATLVSGSRYDLTYLRRGAYGTAVGQHLAGGNFARLDNSVVAIPYTADQIGKTLYLKFPAFNIYGGGAETLAQVPATQIALPAPPPPPNVANFSAVQNGEVVTFTWASVSDNAVVGYDIRYGPFGVSAWEAMLPLTEAAKSTEMTNASVPAGIWTFAVRARDVANQLSPLTTTTSLQVVNTYGPVSSLPQAPAWSAGTLSGFVTHYTGVLVPDSASLAGADTGFAVLDNFVWNPVAQCVYTAPAAPFAKLALLRAWASIVAALGPGAAGKANPLLYVRWSQNLGGDPPMWAADPGTQMWSSDPTTLMWTGLTGWTLWTKGTILTTYVQQQLVVNTADGLPIIRQFTPVVDQPPLSDGANGVAVAAGGQRINFANPNFLAPPAVTVAVASVAGGGGGAASSVAVDANCFTAHVFNAAGTDVGGSINWSAHD